MKRTTKKVTAIELHRGAICAAAFTWILVTKIQAATGVSMKNQTVTNGHGKFYMPLSAVKKLIFFFLFSWKLNRQLIFFFFLKYTYIFYFYFFFFFFFFVIFYFFFFFFKLF